MNMLSEHKEKHQILMSLPCLGEVNSTMAVGYASSNNILTCRVVFNPQITLQRVSNESFVSVLEYKGLS